MIYSEKNKRKIISQFLICCRYDGIYKVVKYYPQRGDSGLLVWKYLLRRDDPRYFFSIKIFSTYFSTKYIFYIFFYQINFLHIFPPNIANISYTYFSIEYILYIFLYQIYFLTLFRFLNPYVFQFEF